MTAEYWHVPDSEFTRETTRVLQQRAGVRPNHQMTGAPRPVDQALGNDNT